MPPAEDEAQRSFLSSAASHQSLEKSRQLRVTHQRVSAIYGESFNVVVHALMLLHTLKLLMLSWRQMDLTVLGYILTSAFEVVVIWNSIDCALQTINGASYKDVGADRSLLKYGVLLPVINALWSFTLPTFDVTVRNWFAFYILMLMLLRTNRGEFTMVSDCGGRSVSEFSQVSYGLAHWIISCPVFLVLGDLQDCQSYGQGRLYNASHQQSAP
ncbi:hypothetical protein CEUSTIGMA_g10634.t1 [Chlamydomonas eustigma]|uniref:Uncharacterized protein n=1 Tax=Chlamydomonas eustigma TaxID=1157962 RepID=A0A250XJG0_9CHLO|nr:hypothetical protein CEUSTIGMA_g10634.t1 [Chlamydomonas eustigma]|eukprot:GAX83208.1 hypothetical protein CEUSTIGMA_g10634.t1 [Chlamydomonas eustigma]